MRWSKKNKDMLWRALKTRARQLNHNSWLSLSDSCGITLVYRGHQINSRSMKWMERHDGGSFKFMGASFAPATSKNHIIIDDIFHDNPGWGWKIPKEVALKFLTLGVP